MDGQGAIGRGDGTGCSLGDGGRYWRSETFTASENTAAAQLAAGHDDERKRSGYSIKDGRVIREATLGAHSRLFGFEFEARQETEGQANYPIA